MRAYIGTTAAVFLMLVIAHAARVVAEGSGPLRNPVFVTTTLVSLAFVLWAAVILRKIARRN
jgi:hypothetical protein